MKQWLRLYSLPLLVMVIGCSQSTTVTEIPPIGADVSSSSEATESTPENDVATHEIALTPDNTSIKFIGNHTSEDPRPRHGRFEQFAGTAFLANDRLKSVSLEIQTRSLTTEIEKLTNHLKNADFFDVNQFPTATFQSTDIQDNEDGTALITGNLTLLDNQASVTFPASIDTSNGLKLHAEFELDRMKWGMDYGPDQIERMVPMTITINH